MLKDEIPLHNTNKAREEIDLDLDEEDDYTTKNLSLNGNSGYEHCFTGTIKEEKPTVMSLRERAL